MKKLIILVALVTISSAFNDPLPKLFLIGDSISIMYEPYLRKYMEGIVLFERKQDDGQAEKNLDVPAGANGGDSRMVLAYLRSKIKDPAFKPDYLLLNCGLHDIKRNPDTGKIQVNEAEYKDNLENIFKLLRKRKIKLIWIRTTPVVDTIHNKKSSSFHRFASDVKKYNEIADELCRRYSFPAIDLFDFTQKMGIEQFKDHVHYKDPVCSLQAAFIAGFLKRYLEE